MTTLTGKVAVITGASRGIGAALARLLDKQGVKLGLASRRGNDLGLDAVAQRCDVREYAQVESLVNATVERFGRLDILVANAGVGHVASYEEVDGALFDETLAVNLRAPYLLARHVLPGMRARIWSHPLHLVRRRLHRGDCRPPLRGFQGSAARAHPLLRATRRAGRSHRERDRAGADRGHRNRPSATRNSSPHGYRSAASERPPRSQTSRSPSFGTATSPTRSSASTAAFTRVEREQG